MIIKSFTYNNKLLTFVLIFLICLLTSCNTTRKNVFAPLKLLFSHIPEDAPKDFKDGYNDGCESGLATGFANDYYKTFYSFKKDKNRLTNTLYSRAWSRAYIYCRHSALGSLKDGGMLPLLPSQDGWGRFRLEKESVFSNVMTPTGGKNSFTGFFAYW